MMCLPYVYRCQWTLIGWNSPCPVMTGTCGVHTLELYIILPVTSIVSISVCIYFPFDLIRQPWGRGVLIAAGVNIRQPLTQQGPRPVLIMFPFYNLFLCIALKIAAGAFLFCLISNVLVIAYLTRPSSSGGSTGYIFFLFYQIFKTNKL